MDRHPSTSCVAADFGGHSLGPWGTKSDGGCQHVCSVLYNSLIPSWKESTALIIVRYDLGPVLPEPDIVAQYVHNGREEHREREEQRSRDTLRRPRS
jgi:hypothetical protein